MLRKLNALFFCLLIGVVACPGCGGNGDRPELGQVRGTVTMDGQPLANVIISFKPDVGRAATGQTDSSGRYELEYLYRTKGCKIGPNTVSFEWPLGQAGAPLPAKYTTKSELKVEVKAGSNTFDFNLESDKSAPARPAVD